MRVVVRMKQRPLTTEDLFGWATGLVVIPPSARQDGERFIQKHRIWTDDLEVRSSRIHGTGIFATKAIPKGAVLELGDLRGAFNHSDTPNAAHTLVAYYSKFFALRDIPPDEEVTVSYGRPVD